VIEEMLRFNCISSHAHRNVGGFLRKPLMTTFGERRLLPAPHADRAALISVSFHSLYRHPVHEKHFANHKVQRDLVVFAAP
jgi:hypothetical protein